MKKIKIGISLGDINGIGLEVALKALADKRMKDLFIPIIYGSSKVVAYHKNIVGLNDLQFQSLQDTKRVNPNKLNVVNCWQDNVNIELGKVTEEGGKYAFEALKRAVADLKDGHIDALVTAPINKQSMKLANFPFPGHTEYLTKEIGGKQSLMLMVNDDLRIGVATNHEPLQAVAGKITKDLVMAKLKIMDETLRMDFGIEKPNIAVLGLNPHASDGGAIGNEEEKVIRPAIVQSKKSGLMAYGPFSADGFFGSAEYRKYDGILAMYHDQGLIPFKTISFGNGVNFTAGLHGIRTSPDHGTGFDIAGKNEANPASFRAAIFVAIDTVRNRQEHLALKDGALTKKTKHSQEDSNATAEKMEE